jgi:hypothetical protein
MFMDRLGIWREVLSGSYQLRPDAEKQAKPASRRSFQNALDSPSRRRFQRLLGMRAVFLKKES